MAPVSHAFLLQNMHDAYHCRLVDVFELRLGLFEVLVSLSPCLDDLLSGATSPDCVSPNASVVNDDWATYLSSKSFFWSRSVSNLLSIAANVIPASTGTLA